MPSDDVMPAAFLGHGNPMNALDDEPLHRGVAGLRRVGAAAAGDPGDLGALVHQRHAVTAMAAPAHHPRLLRVPRRAVRRAVPGARPPELAEAVQRAADPWVGRGPRQLGHRPRHLVGARARLPRRRHPRRAAVASTRTSRFDYHLELGAKLAPLRERGRADHRQRQRRAQPRPVDWSRPDAGYDWAQRFDDAAPSGSLDGDPAAVARLDAHPDFALAVPTPDHFMPVLYLAGLAGRRGARAPPLVDGYAYGSLSMDSFTLGTPAA